MARQSYGSKDGQTTFDRRAADKNLKAFKFFRSLTELPKMGQLGFFILVQESMLLRSRR